MTDLTAASRQARRRERLAKVGVQSVTVLVPAAYHMEMKQLAARLVAGETLDAAYRAVSLKVPPDLIPGPGEVAVAVRTGKRTTGYTHRLIARAGLVRRDDADGLVGIVSKSMADRLTARANGVSTTVVRRESPPNGA